MLSRFSNKLTAAVLCASLAIPAAPAAAKDNDVAKALIAALIAGVVINQLNNRAHADTPPVYTPPKPPAYHPPVYQPPVYQPPVYQPAPSVYTTPAAQAFNSYSRNERLRIQSTLSAYGYYRGAIDGSFGPGTYQAVTAFAQSQGRLADLNSRSGAYGVYDGLIY